MTILVLDRLIKVPSLKNFRQRINKLRKEPVLNLTVNSFFSHSSKYKVSQEK